MRVAMLGAGYVANMYRLTMPLHPELVLTGVYDVDATRTKEMARLTSSRAYPSLEALLADARVDLVMNLTNPRAHFETTLACLNAGKHVYTEKPIALELERAKKLVALADEKRLMLSSAPCTLLNEAAQTLWKAVRERVVGRIRMVYAEMDDGMVHRMPVQKWVNEAGVVWPYVDEFETGCTVEHAGYVLTWLAAMFGPAASVTAFSTTIVPDKLPGRAIETARDFSVGCVVFKSGVVARITCGLYAPVDHQLKVFGDDGVLVLQDPRRDRSPLYYRKYLTLRRARRLTPWRRQYPLVESGRKQVKYRGSQQRDFCSGVSDMAKALERGKACRLSAAFCLHVNEITLALHGATEQARTYEMTTTFGPIEPLEWAR
jgi:predicted dehydrogenase